MQHDHHHNAPTRHLDVNGVRYAYRRFGADHGTPLLLLQHFRGGMDNWDPALTDGFAASRPVILFNNAGVASSAGATPDTVEAMADHAAAFAVTLGLARLDVLGFSLGGYVAQALALRRPDLVRRLILAGTGPRGGQPRSDAAISATAARAELGEAEYLRIFFTPSAASQAAGRAFWQRSHRRVDDVDPPTSPQTMQAQVAAIRTWGLDHAGQAASLAGIIQPTLVVNGSADAMVPTINSLTLAQGIPDATLIVYPDAGHAALFQHAPLFLLHAGLFLER